MSRACLRLAFAILIISPAVVTADAKKHEWFGSWTMNHDGHVGTLRIAELKADCVSPLWCDMVVTYTDADGKRYQATIQAFDDKLQHLRFQVGFPGNNQPFDAYLFSWDKSKMAGTTRWGGRTFGFFATKG
jgi:hypothetical protein